jgi:hypothetical protein
MKTRDQHRTQVLHTPSSILLAKPEIDVIAPSHTLHLKRWTDSLLTTHQPGVKLYPP